MKAGLGAEWGDLGVCLRCQGAGLFLGMGRTEAMWGQCPGVCILQGLWGQWGMGRVGSRAAGRRHV